jgi:hypothetical protein
MVTRRRPGFVASWPQCLPEDGGLAPFGCSAQPGGATGAAPSRSRVPMADGEFMENPLAAGDLSPGVDPTGNTSPRSPTIQGMAPVGDSENGLKNFLDSTPYQVSRGADAKTDAVRGVFGAGGGALRRSGSAGRPRCREAERVTLPTVVSHFAFLAVGSRSN